MSTQEENPKILIADDSAILNNMLRDVFEENGFDVVQAFDGVECKSVFLRQEPDLALIDVQMPRIDGIELLRFIKEKSPRTLVIVMTGAGSEQLAVQSMKLGADDYLNKPFGLSDVITITEKLLERRRSAEENVRLRKQIRRSERYLAHLTKIINEALVTTDPNGRIQFVNRAAESLWGYSEHELKGKDVHFLIRGEAGTLLHRDLVKETLRLGKIEGEFLFRKKDKGAFPGYLSTSVIKENKTIKGIVIVVADLTRLNEVERRLKQSEKLASLGRVVEGVAHEVRNCLTSLGGFSLRLRKSAGHDPSVLQYTGIILEDVHRLETMVHEIEDYVRFSKFYAFQFVKTDILSVIESARDKVLRTIPEELAKSVTFSVKADGSVLQIQADPAALEEAFFNLFVNAYEAMPRGGRLRVTVRNCNSAILVTVADTGVGIHSGDLSEIFNPFFTSKTSGAGMGLCKVHLLVEEHRGAVNVTSEPNKGTVFEILLPSERLLTQTHPWEAVSGGKPVR
jgi:two-component system, cell cycle sensor histidine kinase and response regulator CckA